MKERIEKLKALYKRVDAKTGGRLDIFVQSYLRFINLGGPEAAAGMAYYALFSLFPLTLLLVSALGYIIDNKLAYSQALTFVRGIVPFAGELIDQNLSLVLQRRTAIGAVGLLGLIWAASGFFTMLAHNVNKAWPSVKLRNFVQGRLVALGMVGALFLLLLLSLISSTVLGVLPSVVSIFGLDPAILQSGPLRFVLRLVPALFTFLLFLALYRWVPNKTVGWRPAMIGAGVMTGVWELAKWIFTIYLTTRFADYEIVYGSLGTLIAVMLWIYVSNVIAIFGAHIVATLDVRAEQQAMAEQREQEVHEAPAPHTPEHVRAERSRTEKPLQEKHVVENLERAVKGQLAGNSQPAGNNQLEKETEKIPTNGRTAAGQEAARRELEKNSPKGVRG